MKKKVAIISVISDVYTDQRILRTASVLKELNYDILIIGRQTKHLASSKITHSSHHYHIQHIHPLFQKGIGMYACFNLLLLCRLFYWILKYKSTHILLYANDLDTLIPNYILSKLFHLPIVYDAHELFTEVPELQYKSIKKKIWQSIEKKIIPTLPFAITVNESIARIYQQKYHTLFYVIRNLSSVQQPSYVKSRTELNLPTNKKIIILQGTGINIHRGAEELVEAMQYLNENYLLLIIGGGDVFDTLKKLVQQYALSQKVKIYDRMPADELYHYTCCADLGISIDKADYLNYLYSLPNKIFSYIHAHIPILASRLPEIEKIINQYQIGMFIDNHQPTHIADKIQEALHHPLYLQWKQNTYKASKELNWNIEKEKLKTILQKHINH